MAADFAADPIFRALYLLYLQGRSAIDSQTMRTEFILWFLVHGRSTFAHPFVVPDEMIEAVTQLDSEGRHLLMNYAVSQDRPDLLKRSQLVRAYYYGEVLYRFGSARLIGLNELRWFATNDKGKGALLEMPAEPRNGRDAGGDRPDLSLLHALAKGVSSDRSLPSVSIIGFHRSVLGIGEDARSLFHCLLDAGIRCELVDLSPPSLTPFESTDRYRLFEVSRPSASILIFCMPPFEMMRAVAVLGLEATRTSTYRIGIWPWETTQLPDDWLFAFNALNEIWAISSFLAEVFSKASHITPVVQLPLPVEVEAPISTTLVSELIDEKFCVLCIFDFNSRIERKNPIGAIQAFRAAFPDQSESVRLVLKTLNQASNGPNFETVMREIGTDDRIVVVDGPLSPPELSGLIKASAVYLSLHRAEGLGRTVAEAMLLGTPVVATEWSGTADYLSELTGFPVGSKLRPVRAGEYPHAAGEWADPDINQASRALRKIFDDPNEAKLRSKAAARLIRTKYSRTSVSKKLGERLHSISANVFGVEESKLTRRKTRQPS